MTNITNINSQRFTLNGISYYKNFLSQIVGDPVAGDVVRIVNAYDSKFELLRPTKISNISVNGLTYPNAVSLQMALLPILYSRGTLGDGNSSENGIVQMGPLEIIDRPSTTGSVALKIPIEPVFPIWRIGGIDYTKETETVIDIPAAAESKYRVDTIVANTANGFERIVGEERVDVGIPPQLPYNVVIVTQINIYGDLVNDGDPTPPPPFPLDKYITKGSKRYRSYTLTSETSSTLMLSHEYTTHLLKNAAGSGIVKGFLSLNDSQSGYAYDGMDVYVKNFGAVDVTLKHNDNTATVPFWFANGQDLLVKQHEILHMKFNAGQNRVELLKIGGNGAAYSITSNQAAQELYLKDIDGNTISTISVAFLNNEGTTFFYNETTEKLELKNDAGEVLSEIPVSAFVSNVAVALEITGSELKLKDTEGNVLSTVTLTKSAVGLGSVDNTSDMDKPVSTAQAAAIALKVAYADSIETITTSSGSVTAEPTPTSFLKFTNQTTPVILSGLTDVEDGKEVTIWNESLQAMDLLHESPSALATERLHIIGERDVLLPVGGKAMFRYSESESKWTMVGIFGAGYQPTLIGSTKRAVTVSASGVVDAEELMEMMVWNTGITTNQTNADLNLAYPNAMNGFTVVAVNNNREYVMYDDVQGEWFFRQITKLGI